MMGVYIKGMEMPKNCGGCVMCYYDVHWSCFLTKRRVCKADRSKHCPLVPVPPHGRLIDADALKLSHCVECTLYPDKCLEKTMGACDWGSVYHIEHCAPTIIESEEGK